MRAAHWLLAALLAAPALLVPGCEGTSSGVDNPEVAQLTVDFRDAQGAEMPVSGDLDVFAEDQNPALYPEPLATIKVRNASRTILSGKDFDRIRGRFDPPTKRSAGSSAAPRAPADSPFAFNVVFRSKYGLGTLASGLAYDPARRAFALSGAVLPRLVLRPGPVGRYAARLQRAAVHGDLGRVYIPGSPYLSALADSGFVLEDLPEGVFGLRLLAGDGNIYAVAESLDTRVDRTYTATSVPLGHIDSSDTVAKPMPFTVQAYGPPEAFAGTPTLFDAKVVGSDSLDSRASFLWRQIDSVAVPGVAHIKNPAAKPTEITFPSAGVYTLVVSATIGVTTARDTIIQKVRDAPVPAKPRIVFPKPGDTLVAGTGYKLSWEMPAAGTATVELSRTGRLDAWEPLAHDVPSVQGMSYFAWVPGDSLAPSPTCLLRVRLRVGAIPDTLVAVSEKPFALLARGTAIPPPPIVKPGDTLPKP